jgi:hypothetical protein
VGYSRAQSDFGGFNNTPNYTSKMGFAALKADGSIMAWGNSYFGRNIATLFA